ncbi:hypothetical protein [Plesiomonas shigelloides]|uniref:hypothetical protein n=1 Tax=Plesiomonas shigelloides TaxID=703 RepID=UPI00224853F4|nr:hypothetical protein [Plesiomonas shigelloides]MCX2498521.1 hypothetical protein [Plesiomonas shigelloides]
MSYEVRMILFLSIFIVASVFLFDTLLEFIAANYRGGILRVMMCLMRDEPINDSPVQDSDLLQVLYDPLG